MIDLDWIIKEENNLTDKAKFNLGDNYQLLLNLLELLQGIKSFSVNNEVAHYFETQVLKDFHLASLNFIRRHSIIANVLIRHALESSVLFAYSMEHPSRNDYVIDEDVIDEDVKEIIDFDDKLLEKAQKEIENKYPDFSKRIELYKRGINTLYSHSNIFASQYNATIKDGRIKSLIFDAYYDNFIRESLCILNDTIILILGLYKKLFDDYKLFTFEDWFDNKFDECWQRHEKLKEDILTEVGKQNRKKYPALEKIIKKINNKYDNTKKLI